MSITTHPTKINCRQFQRGFSMLEVLVAILVVAIGLLGLAGLMNAGLRNNQSSSAQTQAVWLAYDMLDRLRADRAVALAGGYDLPMGGAPGGSGFTNTELVGWRTLLANALPSGTGSVAVNGNAVSVIVQWSDDRVSGGATAQQLQVDSQL